MLFNQNIFGQKRKAQEPLRPFPYIEKEVEFKNATDGTLLHGTLTLPTANQDYPAVILVTGSGAQDREEEILGHRPFLVLADYLTRAGIAVLRYDDRHFNMPIEQGWKYTTMDLAGDASAALDFLTTQKNINPKQIGVLGHSEGGLIASIIASTDKRVTFIISMAGPGLSGFEIATSQAETLAKNAKEFEFSKKSIETIIHEPLQAERKRKLKAIHKSIYSPFNFKAKRELNLTIEMSTSEWNRFYILYNPSEAWSNVSCPVLALFGEYDIQVLPKENTRAINEALKKANNSDYSLVTIPKANHLFQTEGTSQPKDYAALIREYKNSKETISPDVLKHIRDWILSKCTTTVTIK